MGSGNSTQQKPIQRSKSQQNVDQLLNFQGNIETGRQNQQQQNGNNIAGTVPNSQQNTQRNLEFIQQVQTQQQTDKNQNTQKIPQKNIQKVRSNSNAQKKYKNSIDLESVQGKNQNIIKEDHIKEQEGHNEEQKQIQNKQKQNQLNKINQNGQDQNYHSRPISGQSQNNNNSIKSNEKSNSIQQEHETNQDLVQRQKQNLILNKNQTVQNLTDIKKIDKTNPESTEEYKKKLELHKQQTIKQQQLTKQQIEQEKKLKQLEEKQKKIDEFQKQQQEKIQQEKEKAEKEILEFKKSQIREQKMKIKKHTYQIQQEMQKDQIERQKMNEEMEQERLKLERLRQQRLKEEAQEAYRIQKKFSQENIQQSKSRSRSNSNNKTVYMHTQSKNTPNRSIATTPTNKQSKIGNPQRSLLQQQTQNQNEQSQTQSQSKERKNSMGVMKAFQKKQSNSAIKVSNNASPSNNNFNKNKKSQKKIRFRSSKSVNSQIKIDPKEIIEKQKYEQRKAFFEEDPADPVKFFATDIYANLSPQSLLKRKQKNRKIQKLLHKLYLSKKPGYSQDDYPHIFTPKHEKQKKLEELKLQKKLSYEKSVPFLLKKQKQKELEQQMQKQLEYKTQFKKKPRPRDICKIPIPKAQSTNYEGFSQENSLYQNSMSIIKHQTAGNLYSIDNQNSKLYYQHRFQQSEQSKIGPLQTIQNANRPQTSQYYQYNPTPGCNNCSITNLATRSQLNSRSRQMRSQTSHQMNRTQNINKQFSINNTQELYNQQSMYQQQQEFIEIQKLQQQFPQMNEEQLIFYRKITHLSEKIDKKTQNNNKDNENLSSSKKLPYLLNDNNQNQSNNNDNFNQDIDDILLNTPNKNSKQIYHQQNKKYEDTIFSNSPLKPQTSSKKKRPNSKSANKRIQRSQSTNNHTNLNFNNYQNDELYILQGKQPRRIEEIKQQIFQYKRSNQSQNNDMYNYKKQNNNYLMKYKKTNSKGILPLMQNKNYDDSFNINDLNESRNQETINDTMNSNSGIKSIKTQYFLLQN